MRRRALVAVLIAGSLVAGPGRAELVDPTRPALSRHPAPDSAEIADGALVLRSVMLSMHQRVAVINDRRVQAGDRVFGALVVEITLSGVRLRRSDGDVVLTLTGASVKQPSSAPWRSR